MSSPVLMPTAERLIRPWKNGGGTTQDIAVFPPGSKFGDCDWRLSIASMVSDGPFSHFAGVDRHLAVLQGLLALEGEGITAGPCAAGDEPLSFAGDRPVFGRILDSPVRDLNLMTRRSAFRGRLRRTTWIDNVCMSETTILIAPLPITLAIDGTCHSLALLDAILIKRGSRVRSANTLLAAEIEPLKSGQRPRISTNQAFCLPNKDD